MQARTRLGVMKLRACAGSVRHLASMSAPDKPYQLRFRHLNGDIGPLPFQDSTSVSNMKTAIFENWPSSGALAAMVRLALLVTNNCGLGDQC